jgi:hypothetical protein
MRRQKAVGTTVGNFSRLLNRTDRGEKRYPDRLKNPAPFPLHSMRLTKRLPLLSMTTCFRPLRQKKGKNVTFKMLLNSVKYRTIQVRKNCSSEFQTVL